MKCKVGDKVFVKSEGWYEINKDANGVIQLGSIRFLPDMAKFCGKQVTVSYVLPGRGYVMEELKGCLWQDWMLVK